MLQSNEIAQTSRSYGAAKLSVFLIKTISSIICNRVGFSTSCVACISKS